MLDPVAAQQAGSSLQYQDNAPEAIATANPEWTGLYFSGRQVGFSSNRTVPTVYEGKPALLSTVVGVTRLPLNGAVVEEEEQSETVTDGRHRLLKQTFNVTSKGSLLHVEARFDAAAQEIDCTVGHGEGATHKTLVIPPGVNLAADTHTLTHGRDLKPGMHLVFAYLDPVSVKLRTATVDVTGRATITDDTGGEITAFVVQMQVSGGIIVAWTDAKGDPIKSEITVGNAILTQVRETKPHALDPSYISPALTAPAAAANADFAEATAIVPDRPIPAPRQLRLLQAVISGVPANNLLPSDARQSAETLPQSHVGTRPPRLDAAGLTVRFTMRAEQIDPATPARWPVTDRQFKPYLARAAYLETDDPQIRQVAMDLRGNETDLYRIASSIRNWVARQMTPDAGIGVPRSARDVFDRRHGVCRDYATLFAALARAAGVPTRLCAGIVYNQGRFCYHAWAECYVGRWVAFDPTLYSPGETEAVDATHIKFAQGDVTQMFDVIAIIGRLKIRIERIM